MAYHAPVRRIVLLGLLASAVAHSATAQNWSFDARRIALGGVGDTRNVASKLVEAERRYSSIVIPLGLVQVLRDFDVFNPDDDAFDPVRAMEYAASPLHFTFGRDTDDTGDDFVADIVTAEFNRDLNAYRGFQPASELVAEGLAAPSWGKTFVVSGDRDGPFHGIYVGAGPYFSVQTDARIDPDLIDLLGREVDTYLPNTRFEILDGTTDQLALAITGGYRARLPLVGGSAGARDGIYLAANYHFLRGFHYDDFGLTVNLDTDAAGLLTVLPASTPVVIDRLTSDRGRGFALDFGIAFVVDRWDFGFGTNGVANRVEWEDVELERYRLQNLFTGGEFVELPLIRTGETRRVELPVTYSSDVAYHADTWNAVAEYAHGFQGHNVHAGLEYLLGAVDLRGGARYSRDRWHPSGGVGFNLTPGFAIDVAAFETSTNLERARRLALAVSLRLTGT